MLQHGKKQHGKSAKWKQCPIKSATWKKCNTKKVHTEKVNHECNTKRVKKVKHRENMKSERNSETWVECYTEKVQHDESATRRECNTKKLKMKRVQNEKSNMKKCNMKRVQNGEKASWKKRKTKKQCIRKIVQLIKTVQPKQSTEREREGERAKFGKMYKRRVHYSAQTDNELSVNVTLYVGFRYCTKKNDVFINWRNP